MEKQVVKELQALNEKALEVKQMNEVYGGNATPGTIDTVTCTPKGNKNDDGDPEA